MSLSGYANQIWENEFDSNTGISETYIFYWLQNNIGNLNVLLNTEFVVSGDNFEPVFCAEESGIYTQYFLKEYYKKESRKVLQNITSPLGQVDWISLSEGDTTIKRNNRNELAKTLIQQSKDAGIELKDLVFQYNYYKSGPRQVAGVDGN